MPVFAVKARATDNDMNSRPFKREIGDIFRFYCKDKCEYFGSKSIRTRGGRSGKSCLSRATVDDTQDFIEQVFREVGSAPSSTQERTVALENLFWDSYVPSLETFQFMIGERFVCETTAAFLLGYIDFDDDGFLPIGFPGGWKRAKSRILNARKDGLRLHDLRAEDMKKDSSAGMLFHFQLESVRSMLPSIG